MSVDGSTIQVDIGSGAALRAGDVGVVYFELGESDEVRSVEAGTGRVIEISEYSATLRIEGRAVIKPGYLVRFDLPEVRHSSSSPAVTKSQADLARPEASGEVTETSAELRDRLAQADERLEDARRENLRILEALGEAEKTRQSLTRRLLEATATDLQSQVAELDEERRRLTARIERANDETAKLRAENEDLGVQLESVRGLLADAEVGRDQLRGERDWLTAELEASSSQAAQERSTLEAALAEKGRRLAEIEAGESRLASERDGLAESLEARDQMIGELDQRLVDLRQESERTALAIAEKDARIDQLEAMAGRLTAAELAQGELRLERDRLEKQLEAHASSAAKDRDELEARRAQLERQVDTLEELSSDFSRELAARSQTIDALTEEIERLRTTNEESAVRAAEGDARLAEFEALERRLAAADLSRGELLGERDRLVIEVEELRAGKAADREALETAGTELRRQVDSLQGVSKELTGQVAEKERMVAALTLELEALRRERREDRAANDAASEREAVLAELRASVEDLKRQQLEAEQRAVGAGRRNTELELRLERSRAINAELNRRLDEQARIGGPEPASPKNAGAASSAVSDAATRVERITWREEGAGLAVLIYLDGEIDPADCEVVRLREGRPRDVLKLRGIREVFSPSMLEVPTDLVQSIRTGLHSTTGGQELHIVIDLARPSVGVRGLSVRSKMIVVTIS